MAISLASACTFSAVAHGNDEVEDAIEYRQAVFHLVAAHFGQMGDMIKGKKDFDAVEFQYRANSLDALSKMPMEGFTVPGSDKGDTKAKPAVWEKPALFEEKMTKFQKDSSALAKAAQSGDMDTIKPVFMEAAKNCKSCHTDFKNR
ncbi:cytochrome c [Oceanobacter sp. 2_MG-2023]|nr:cytochrome c [Oceanobacter sp. 2_MG-2023]